jgi:hypothetical protein
VIFLIFYYFLPFKVENFNNVFENFTNNNLLMVKMYRIKTFVVASAIINTDIFRVNLCVCFIYFCTELFIQWYLIIFLKRNNCFIFDLLGTSLQRPSSFDRLLSQTFIFYLFSCVCFLFFFFSQTMLKKVQRKISKSLKIFPAGNHLTCAILTSNKEQSIYLS